MATKVVVDKVPLLRQIRTALSGTNLFVTEKSNGDKPFFQLYRRLEGHKPVFVTESRSIASFARKVKQIAGIPDAKWEASKPSTEPVPMWWQEGQYQ